MAEKTMTKNQPINWCAILDGIAWKMGKNKQWVCSLVESKDVISYTTDKLNELLSQRINRIFIELLQNIEIEIGKKKEGASEFELNRKYNAGLNNALLIIQKEINHLEGIPHDEYTMENSTSDDLWKCPKCGNHLV